MKVLLLLALMVAVASANISNNLVYNFKQSTQNPPENEDNSDENFLQMEMDLIEKMANGKNAASSKSCCIPSKFSGKTIQKYSIFPQCKKFTEHWSTFHAKFDTHFFEVIYVLNLQLTWWMAF